MRLSLSYLRELEAESIYFIREATSQFDKPALLFSGGKDSIVLTHLAIKAFWPSKLPFPLVHIDTGHNFSETIRFRDEFCKKIGAQLIVGSVEESIRKGDAREETGPFASRNSLQTITLRSTIQENGFDCCFGGARRDEEKARAKERYFSHRDSFGQWEPKNQRPEPWGLLNPYKQANEHFRVFPLSDWTELDVWEYIRLERIQLPSLYYSHERDVYERQGVTYAHSSCIQLAPGETVERRTIRFRTIGDITCTGGVSSSAANVDEVIDEIRKSRITERGTRADDKRSETAMEDRKRGGYF